MHLSERLSEDLKKTLKAGEKDALSVIRMIKAAIKNKEIEKGTPLGDEEINGVLLSLARQRKESIEQFSRANRQDLVEKETRELSIIKSYMPRQLTEEELKVIIEDAIKEIGAGSQKDTGKVMKFVMAKVKGQVDGKLVSKLVKNLLADGS
ncbi:MAG: GatB/YqeY domain-containing protein [Thermodesulfovibrionia bacterium]|nr:GatB/YqeY domain-containing protein [Thermodesulfovibrionia bacterium]